MINESKNESKLSLDYKQDFLFNIKSVFEKNMLCTIQVLIDEHYGVILPIDEIEPQKKVTI